MPVFGIVPYRTEARTHAESMIQRAVDDLLLILRIVNNAIRTAEGRLFELFIPPPILPPPKLPPGHRYADRDERAGQRTMRITLWPRPTWGTADYEKSRLVEIPAYRTWGTIQ